MALGSHSISLLNMILLPATFAQYLCWIFAAPKFDIQMSVNSLKLHRRHSGWIGSAEGHVQYACTTRSQNRKFKVTPTFNLLVTFAPQ